MYVALVCLSFQIFQRRTNGSIDFYQTWTMYKVGFGAKSGEHWLGNDKLHIITNQKDYSLRVDLMDNAGRSYYARYNLFRIGDENNKYRLNSLGSYSGTAGLFVLITILHHNNTFTYKLVPDIVELTLLERLKQQLLLINPISRYGKTHFVTL